MGYYLLDLVIPVVIAFSCGVMIEQIRTRQRARKLRRITSRLVEWD